MMATKRTTDEQVIDALYRTGGVIAQAAELLGYVGRQGLWARIKASDKLMQAVEDAKEAIIDRAETTLIAAQNEEYEAATFGPATRYILDKKGHARGYTDKSEVKVSGDEKAPLVISGPRGGDE